MLDSISEWIGLIGITISVITSITIPIKKIIKKKKEDKQKPVWDLHVVTIVIAILFIVYFFVPTAI